MELKGRRVLITGSGQGIGRAYAHAFAKEGAEVFVNDVNTGAASDVVADIVGEGGIAEVIPFDVSDEEQVSGGVASIPHLDILVNNAAIFSSLAMRPFEEIPVDEFRKVLDVNVTGSFLCAKAALPQLRRSANASIVNVSSSAVTLGRSNYLHYITSKAAVIGMTRSMARELGSDGIRVNAILPGPTFTEIPRATVTPAQKEALVAQQCLPRAAAPDDIVGAVLFLAGDHSRFITGQSIVVDGGLTHL